MVFDGVVGSSFENVCNVGPFVGEVTVEKVQDPLFLVSPYSLSLNHWVQVIVPPLTTLFANAPR